MRSVENKVAWKALFVLLMIAIPSVEGWQLRAQGVDRVSASDMQNALVRSLESGSRGGVFRASRDNNAQYLMNRRDEASVIELHCGWDDVLFIRSGAGELEHGRKLRGLTRYGASEWRATQIVTPDSTPLAAGDVVRIPAGEAHRIRPLGDAPLVYLVVKMRSFESTPCGSLPGRGK